MGKISNPHFSRLRRRFHVVLEDDVFGLARREIGSMAGGGQSLKLIYQVWSIPVFLGIFWHFRGKTVGKKLTCDSWSWLIIVVTHYSCQNNCYPATSHVWTMPVAASPWSVPTRCAAQITPSDKSFNNSSVYFTSSARHTNMKKKQSATWDNLRFSPSCDKSINDYDHIRCPTSPSLSSSRQMVRPTTL